MANGLMQLMVVTEPSEDGWSCSTSVDSRILSTHDRATKTRGTYAFLETRLFLNLVDQKSTIGAIPLFL